MAENKPIRVMIVDDYDILRNGVAMSLRMFPDIQLVAEAASGAEAVERCGQIPLDVILMDLIMPGMDGVNAIRLIQAKYPDIRILALTSFDTEELIHASIQANVAGYLLKNVSAHELADAIRAVHAGKSVFANEATQVLVHAAQRPSAATLKLTNREREVLTLIVKGASNNEIAHHLIVSESTVKKHVSSILRKLDVSSRTEAVAFALHNRIPLN